MIKFKFFLCFFSLFLGTLYLTLLPHVVIAQEVGRPGSAVTDPQVEERVFSLVNRFRIRKGLNSLVRSDFADQLARQHSLDMANGVVPFGHQGADERFNLIKQTIPNVSRLGENVAFNQGFSDPARRAFRGWKKSPGHRKNMLGNFNRTGVGVARNSANEYYFTQIFFQVSVRGEEQVIEDAQDQIKVLVNCLSEEELNNLDDDILSDDSMSEDEEEGREDIGVPYFSSSKF